MSMLKRSLVLGAGLLGLSALAAPVPVADGYVDWSGLTAKNHLFGRTLTPSDLRQRTVVYVVVDGETFTNAKLKDFVALASIAALPAGHVTQWETEELPHGPITVFSVRNVAKGTDATTFAATFRPPKDTPASEVAQYSAYSLNMIPFYKGLAPVGEAELADDKLPFVAVYATEGAEPVHVQEKYQPADFAKVRAAVKAAKEKEIQDWTPPLGIREPQHYKQVPALLAKGKPAAAALKILAAGLKSKDAEQAKEAQIMYDALNQYASGLKLRIGLEHHAAPARAYYDLQTLVKLFPSEKKKMQAIDQAFKQNKELGSLGKIFEKLMLWSRDDFVPKSAGEAKKIVVELQKCKKQLDLLANSANAQVQGEAMLFSSQLDSLIEIIPTKVPSK